MVDFTSTYIVEYCYVFVNRFLKVCMFAQNKYVCFVQIADCKQPLAIKIAAFRLLRASSAHSYTKQHRIAVSQEYGMPCMLSNTPFSYRLISFSLTAL